MRIILCESNPLIEDKDDEISEDTTDEEKLGNELTPYVDVLLEMEVVENAETTKRREITC